MRTYYDIQLGDRTVTKRELAGEDLVKVGRNHIARTLLELGAATVDPLSPANPLIFSAGPFAGSSFSNANRTSVGCKSPLTGGIKEANGGGTFGYGMGQLRIAGFTLHGASPDWVVLHFRKDGSLDFDDARPYLGKGNFEANRMLLARYGKKVATALCGPVGEYQGLIAGIAFTDKDLRPSRLAARGGVGAVLGSKKVKAIVLDLDKIPPFADPKKTNASIKDYVDASGKEIVSPVEYETLGLLGSNCGLTDPDDLAGLNEIANDMGVDTIETGATLAVLMEAGLGRFGDAKFMAACLREMMQGTPQGRIWAQGTARVGQHYKVRRVPVIKKQAISAYDPRVVEATGISMMATAQGADHTAGNLPRLKTREMDLNALLEQSLIAQINCAATDSLGLCIFGRSVTEPNTEWLANALNGALGTNLTKEFFPALGRETLKLEHEFNRRAGFTEKDDELPEFFYSEPLAPTNHVARLHGQDVHWMYERLPA